MNTFHVIIVVTCAVGISDIGCGLEGTLISGFGARLPHLARRAFEATAVSRLADTCSKASHAFKAADFAADTASSRGFQVNTGDIPNERVHKVNSIACNFTQSVGVEHLQAVT
eukprot:6482393-Amphidinium_carterae.2